jgi:hypothetical protein
MNQEIIDNAQKAISTYIVVKNHSIKKISDKKIVFKKLVRYR